MKSAAARAQPVDVAKQDAAVDAAWKGYERSREEWGRRRLALGEALVAVRGRWPRSGPKARGWGEYLAARGIDQDVALDAMAYAGYLEENPPAGPGELPSRREAGLESEPTKAQALRLIEKLSPEDRAEIVKALRVNVSGGSGETDRGSWITSKRWADAVGPFDLDPFSNPRSHIEATIRCMLEDGGDGLGADEEPGSWIAGPEPLRSGVATEVTRVWIQPPYDIVERVIAHYGHTRFCALLRLDSSTAWFAALWERTQVLALPKGTREFFEPPPGVPSSSNPQPHAFYYADPRDITDAIRETCILLTRYEAQRHPGLHIVR